MISRTCTRTFQTLINRFVSHQPSSPIFHITATFPRCSLSTCSNIMRTRNVSLRNNIRNFSSEPPSLSKKGRQSPLPFMMISFAVCAGLTGVSYAYSYFKKKELEEERKKNDERKRKEKSTKGKALIGGPFVLVNTEGETVTEKTFMGKWALIYFGFTFCPDICPEELEKIGEIVDLLDKTPEAPKVQPIFISVDPKRDTPELIKSYLQDFHPDFIGLTGTKEQVKRATKAYRVYFSEGPDQAEGANEYIVDHSIVTFLVDPKGDFAANFGQRTSPEEAVSKIIDKMNDFYHGD